MRRKPLFPPVDKGSGQRLLSKGPEPRSTLTVNGRVSLIRKRLYLKGQGSRSPLDALVDAAEATVSVATRDLCVRLNGNSQSFERANENLKAAAQLQMSGEKLRQVVESEGKRVLALEASGQLGPVWMAAQCKVLAPDGKTVTRVYMGCDGFMVPLVTEVEKQKRLAKVKLRRQKRGTKARPLPSAKTGADGPWKECKLVFFYDQEMEHRHVVLTKGNCEMAGLLMSREAGRLGFAAADERVGNIDGGPWIINQIEFQHMPMSATGLDFFHLSQHVYAAGNAVFGEENEAGKAWVAQLLHMVKHEGYEAMWEHLLEWRKGLTRSKRKAADKLIHYVAERKEMILYPEFLARGWQIGSGPTESECRLLPDRLKGAGMRWDADNAEAVMALEAMRISGQSPDYWRMCISCSN
jgi:hypothetical protein